MFRSKKLRKTEVVSSSGTGISFAGLLAIVFIALKLTGYIAWSWWWVLSPLWIPFAIGFIAMIIFLLLIRC